MPRPALCTITRICARGSRHAIPGCTLDRSKKPSAQAAPDRHETWAALSAGIMSPHLNTEIWHWRNLRQMDANKTRRGGLPMRYLLVVWLMVIGGIAFMDRTNISIAGIQMGREYHIDNTHLGWVFSAFLIGYATFQVPGGILARKWGARKVLTLCVIWWGVFTALTAAVPAGAAAGLLILILVRVAL